MDAVGPLAPGVSGGLPITPKGNRQMRVVDTRVRFKRLSREEIESYLVSDEWRGKAGGYAIQGRAEVVRAASQRIVSPTLSGCRSARRSICCRGLDIRYIIPG